MMNIQYRKEAFAKPKGFPRAIRLMNVPLAGQRHFVAF